MKRSDLRKARRLVVKVGTSLLTSADGAIYAARFGQLARQVAELRGQGREVLLVSSGAVGLGLHRLGLDERPGAIPEVQAAAAVGQIDLCRRYERAFSKHGLRVGQILLTHTGLADRERFLNARHTLQALLAAGVVPIINENDSVATDELRFGDNDELSALVVNTCNADLLVLLTDIDGLHDRHPKEPGARRVAEVPEVTPRVMALASPPTSRTGTGGMPSKLEAARSAARFGVPTVIAAGRTRDVLRRILDGQDVGTLVFPSDRQLSSRKHWIAYSLKPRGHLQLDAGAVRAIRERGRSLLPIGVIDVEGHFSVGDPVSCRAEDGHEVARGLISYGSDELQVIKGHRTPRIAELLGYSNGDEVIHRNDLVLL
jgi:glutamate 5-kinase